MSQAPEPIDETTTERVGPRELRRENVERCPCCTGVIAEEKHLLGLSQHDHRQTVEVGAKCDTDECDWGQYTKYSYFARRTNIGARQRLEVKLIHIPAGWVYLCCDECEKGELVEEDHGAAKRYEDIDSPCCGGNVRLFTTQVKWHGRRLQDDASR